MVRMILGLLSAFLAVLMSQVVDANAQQTSERTIVTGTTTAAVRNSVPTVQGAIAGGIKSAADSFAGGGSTFAGSGSSVTTTTVTHTSSGPGGIVSSSNSVHKSSVVPK